MPWGSNDAAAATSTAWLAARRSGSPSASRGEPADSRQSQQDLFVGAPSEGAGEPLRRGAGRYAQRCEQWPRLRRSVDPGGRDLRRMGAVHAHAAYLVVLIVEERDLVLFLEDLQTELHRESERRLVGEALVRGIGERVAAERDFALLAHDLRGMGLQDRVLVVADEGVVVLLTGRRALEIVHRQRLARQGLEVEGIASPAAGEIRDPIGPRSTGQSAGKAQHRESNPV